MKNKSNYNLFTRISREKRTIEKMVKIYCNTHHKTKKKICSNCAELLTYSHFKLDKCKFGKNKPACSRCTIHCYKPDMKQEVRNIMRFAGPRMIYKHPLHSIFFLYNKFKKRKHYSEKTNN